jgi:tRNA modification GTPase
MSTGHADTIFALATARGKAGVAIVRVSGPGSWNAVECICGSLPEPRRAGLRLLRDRAGEVLDHGLVVLFEAGSSFTGEQTAELHLHGSLAVISAVLGELQFMKGLRPAEPGEFTRRALENDRLDLTEVEGLADLIEAETDAQRRQALKVLSGSVGRRVAEWRDTLLNAAALLEATIDFSDEDVPEEVLPEVCELLTDVLADLQKEISGARVRERLREGFEVAIVGPPNIGKSTLLNYLAGRDAAITSEVAGTTRDVIEVRMDLEGLPVTLLDTAGLRESDDIIEKIGVTRALERARSADLRVFLLDGGGELAGLEPQHDDIVVFGKADTLDGNEFGVSGKTGEGVSELSCRIASVLGERLAAAGTIVRVRHRQSLERAIVSLEAVIQEIRADDASVELTAEEVRTAIRALDSLMGRIDVEDVLGRIFASFCIGK